MGKEIPKEPEAESQEPELKDEPLLEDEPAATDPNKTVGELAGEEEVGAEKSDPVAEASQALSENEQSEQQPKPKKSKKPLLVVLVLLLLAAAGYGAWYYYNNYYKDTEPETTEETNVAESAALTYEPNKVIYMFRESEDVPYALYARPAEGGERTEIQKLDRDEGVSQSDVYGSNIVYQSDKGIYVSTDNGSSFNQIMQLDAEEQVTSLKLSTDGSKIVFGHLPTAGGKNTVKSMDLTGENVTDLFTSEQAGIFILGYDSGNKKIIFNRGCYNCGGNTPDPYVRDLSKNEESKLLSLESGQVLWSSVVSFDLTKLVYVYGGTPADSEFEGASPSAPHTIAVLDIGSGESTTIASVGAEGETNANGTPKFRDTIVGFLAGTSTPYYTDETQIYSAQGDTPSLLFESKSKILYVPFVNDSNVIVGTGQNTGDYQLVNYNPETEKTADIYSGDNNTTIIGITTN